MSELSVVIVSYNVRAFLEQALTSIQKALVSIPHEIYLVDNASTDASADLVERRFPTVKLIRNRKNMGFARANNQAIRLCQSPFICLINPDTLVQEDTFKVLLQFLADHPEAGAAGCRILNPDGSLQLACRRSYPTPWVAFTKIIGLAAVFPKSRWFGRYNLTFLDPEQVADVDAISGSFMMLRKEVIEQVGLLDESFFMYGEDLDWCYRIRKRGYKIYYVPDTQIIHFKGESSKKAPFEQRRLFYEAMRLFVLKHFSRGKALVPSWILIGAIWMRAVLSYLSQTLQTFALPMIDLLIMTFSLAMAIFMRFRPEFPWQGFVAVHVIYSLIWLTSLAAHGVYRQSRLSGSKAAGAIVLGWLINTAITYFAKSIAFSRAVVFYAGALNLLLVPVWRIAIKSLAFTHWAERTHLLQESLFGIRSILVGDADSLARVIKRLQRANLKQHLVGIVLSSGNIDELVVEGIPVLGYFDDLNEILLREKINQVLFAVHRLSYNRIFNLIAQSRRRPVEFKLIPNDMDVLIGKSSIDEIDEIPFVELEYQFQNPVWRWLKRILDVVFSFVAMIVLMPVFFFELWIRKNPIMHEKMRLGRARVKVHRFKNSSRWQLLPILWDIFTGRASLVGRDRSHKIDTKDHLGFYLKPGFTSLEQVQNRSDLTTAERERLRLYYIKNYSPLLDVEILLKSLYQSLKIGR
jgi:hypothetical protein